MTKVTLESSAGCDRVVIYPSRGKILVVLLGSIAFVSIGVWLGSREVAQDLPVWTIVIISYIGVAFFGACGLYAVYRLAIRRPALEIDSAGITDSASAVSVGRLSWDEVDRVVIYEYRGQPMLGIIPTELDVFLSRQPPLLRFLIKLNLALGCPPVNVPQVGLSMTVAELADLLQTRYGVRVERDS